MRINFECTLCRERDSVPDHDKATLALTCWKCGAGRGMTQEQQLATRRGMFVLSGAADRKFRDITDEPPLEEPQRRRDYSPSPGKVLVKRHDAARFFGVSFELAKHPEFAGREDTFEVYATVLRVGKATPISGEPWFIPGQDVTIEHSLFRDIHLTPDDRDVVWNGPYSGIIGVFTEAPDAAPETDS